MFSLDWIHNKLFSYGSIYKNKNIHTVSIKIHLLTIHYVFISTSVQCFSFVFIVQKSEVHFSTYLSATGCVWLTWVLQEVEGLDRWLQLPQKRGTWRSRGPSLHEQGWGSAEVCREAWRAGCQRGEQGSVGGSGRVWCWSRREGQWISQV